jgi:hypothetical protein
MVRDAVAPGPMEVEGRAINPDVVHNSLVCIGQFTMNWVLQRYQNHYTRIRRPNIPSDCVPKRGIDYKAQSSDVKRMRQDNIFDWSKFEGLEYRFWSQFHNDYYFICLHEEGYSSSYYSYHYAQGTQFALPSKSSSC